MVDKKARCSKAEILKLRRALVDIVSQHRPLTVRHLFYLAVAAYLIEKNEAEYNNIVIRLTGIMREDWLQAQNGYYQAYLVAKRLFGTDAEHLDLPEVLDEYIIPFGSQHIVDGSRWIRKPESHTSVEDALRNNAYYYRRAL